MNSIFRISMAVAGIAMLTSCGGSKGTGTLELSLKLSTPSTVVALNDVHPTTVATNQSFTPTGFRLPIMKITLSKDNNESEQVLYACDKTEEADCLVDLANQTALDAITTKAQAASVEAGTYTQASLFTCKDGKGGSDQTNAYVTGSTTLNGATWATDATAGAGVVHPGATPTATEATITNWGCATKVVKLNPALTVADKGSAKLSILVDNSFGASVSTQTSPGRGGCKTASATASGDGVCLEYPVLLPYVGTETLTDKRYELAHSSVADNDITDNQANALIFVAMAGTKPVMASGRILYTANSAVLAGNTAANTADPQHCGPNYITETDFSTFTVNADGTIAFQQGGSADTFAAKFSAFKVSDTTESGTVTTRDGSATYYYHAIPLN